MAPAPVAQTFFVERNVSEFARLDGIITLVDAKHIEQQQTRKSDLPSLTKDQGVHMIFDGNFSLEESWEEGEERTNKLVFIGKNLNHEELKRGFEFMACLDTPDNQEKI
jgi:G3E family GTPase